MRVFLTLKLTERSALHAEGGYHIHNYEVTTYVASTCNYDDWVNR